MYVQVQITTCMCVCACPCVCACAFACAMYYLPLRVHVRAESCVRRLCGHHTHRVTQCKRCFRSEECRRHKPVKSFLQHERCRCHRSGKHPMGRYTPELSRRCPAGAQSRPLRPQCAHTLSGSQPCVHGFLHGRVISGRLTERSVDIFVGKECFA